MPVLVDYDLVFLDRSWEWLNDPEIKALTMTPDFTKDEQHVFFMSLPSRNNYWIKGIMADGIPAGAMGLKNITNEDAEYWGYIGEKKYWGKGIGSFMIGEAIRKGKELGLRRLYLHVDPNNERARQLYLRKGFEVDTIGKTEKYRLEL